MATITGAFAVDMTDFNLNRITVGAYNVTTTSNVTFDGIFYNSAVEVDWHYNGGTFASIFAGNNLTTSVSNGTISINGGTLTGYLELFASGGQWVPSFLVENVNYPATAIYQATQTASTTDDFAAFFNMLSGPDTINGSSSNDVLFGLGGNDTINGNAGTDTVIFTGSRSQYSVSGSGGSIIVADAVAGRDGIDTLNSVEIVKFSDVSLIFDITSQVDKTVYLLYQAAYARMPDISGFRYWATTADASNMQPLQLATQFLTAPEFTQKYGNPNDTGYATAMYSNILGRAPDAAGLAFWISQLSHGESRQQLLVDFALSAENLSLTGSHTSNGFWVTG